MGNERKEVSNFKEEITGAKAKIYRGIGKFVSSGIFYYIAGQSLREIVLHIPPIPPTEIDPVKVIAEVGLLTVGGYMTIFGMQGIQAMIEGHAELTAATTAKLLRESLEHPRDNINRPLTP